jgi:hypothetical protein
LFDVRTFGNVLGGGVLIAVLFVAGRADAARLDVQLPTAGDVYAFEQYPPAEGPRISCPPDCTHSQPGTSVGIDRIRVDVKEDPVTKDPGWDIVSLDGCKGTSALPATSAICFLNGVTGDVHVQIGLRYRPILSLTYTGAVNVPLAGLYGSGGAGPGYQGEGTSIACNAVSPLLDVCSQHFTWNQPIRVIAPSGSYANFVTMSEPCGGESTCDFTILDDTCITIEYKPGLSEGFPTATLDGPGCATGNGGGGGGSSTTVPTSSTTTTTLAPDDFLKDLIDKIRQSIPFGKHFGITSTAPSGGKVRTTVTIPSASPALRTAAIPQRAGGDGVLVAKGKRRLRKAGEFTMTLKTTKAGRKLFAAGTAFTATVDAQFKTKDGTAEQSDALVVAP